MKRRLFAVAIIAVVAGCATTFIEFEGECVLQEWQLLGYSLRQRTLCDLPSPDVATEGRLRDRKSMGVNPFPGLLDRNKADAIDPNLLEKQLGYPQEKQPSSSNDSVGGDD